MSTKKNKGVTISVVIPVYGCPDAVPMLHERLTAALTGMQVSYEIILVDDCDGRGSREQLLAVAGKDKRVKTIHFARNAGQDKAIAAGLERASGEYVITMDCDLQDDPDKIPLLYEKIRESGYDIVFVRRAERKDPPVTRALSNLYHRLFSWLSEIDFDYALGTYLIASRRAIEYYRRSKGSGKDLTMYLLWTNLKRDYITLEGQERQSGKSSYTLIKKLHYGFRAVISFSNRLLFVPIYLGIVITLLSVIFIIGVFIEQFFFHHNPEGWNTLAIAVFFFGGFNLMNLGVMGAYIGNIFDVSRERPLYIIQEETNFDTEEANEDDTL